MDPDAASVEVWRFAEGPDAYTRHGVEETLHWRPTADAPALALDVSELVTGPPPA